MAEKDRAQKESAARTNEEALLKPTIKNEQNFPTTLVSSARPVGVVGFAQKAAEAEQRDIAEKAAQEYRKQKAATRELPPDVFVYRRRKPVDDLDYGDTDDEDEPVRPPAGARGTCTATDSEGWATVTRRTHKKRELTDAELDRLARTDILEEAEDMDMNGDLGDTNQRRQFY